MPQLTLAEAIIGAAGLGVAATTVANNVANKNNIKANEQSVSNARQAWLAAQQSNNDWYKKHPEPLAGAPPLPPNAPNAAAPQPPSGTMGNGPATGTSPQPAQVAQSVMRGITPGPSGAPMGSGAMPPPSTNIPPPPPQFNIQAVLQRLAQQGVPIS